MKTHYSSQTGDRQFFWIKDAKSGVWILGQQSRRKNGKFGSGWYERRFVRIPLEMSEDVMLRQFAQHETDTLFIDAAGIKSGITNDSIDKGIANFLQWEKEKDGAAS